MLMKNAAFISLVYFNKATKITDLDLKLFHSHSAVYVYVKATLSIIVLFTAGQSKNKYEIFTIFFKQYKQAI